MFKKKAIKKEIKNQETAMQKMIKMLGIDEIELSGEDLDKIIIKQKNFARTRALRYRKEMWLWWAITGIFIFSSFFASGAIELFLSIAGVLSLIVMLHKGNHLASFKGAYTMLHLFEAELAGNMVAKHIKNKIFAFAINDEEYEPCDDPECEHCVEIKKKRAEKNAKIKTNKKATAKRGRTTKRKTNAKGKKATKK